MRDRSFASLSFFCLTLGCFSLAAGTNSSVLAQPTGAPVAASPSTYVAVLDLSKVFEAHPTFKTDLEGIQQQMKKVEKDFEAKQTELTARGKQLSQLNPTSDDYRRLESDIAQQVANLQVQVRQAKKEFLQREALHYYSVYNEIINAVNRVAQRHNIGLVLRFDSSAIDSHDPQAVAQGINRAVIVQRNLDITPLVVDELQLAAAKSPIRAPRR